MAEVLLNSGSLQQYSALGDEGQPIYSVAAQLRETVRLKVGAAAADCLAIPRVNEARSGIDWYSPRPGMVVPWSAATEQERSDGLRELDQYHQQILGIVSRLDGVSERERRIFQNLLAKVFVFPSPQCLFLVDGRPVLTFWGFQQGKDSVADPFYALRSATASTAAATADPALPVQQSRRRPWWLWLLLLLLLMGLLLWLLRACAPVDVTDPVLPGQNPVLNEPVLPGQVREPVKDTGVVGDVQRWWRSVTGQAAVDGVVDGQTVGTDPDAALPPGNLPDATAELPAEGGTVNGDTLPEDPTRPEVPQPETALPETPETPVTPEGTGGELPQPEQPGQEPTQTAPTDVVQENQKGQEQPGNATSPPQVPPVPGAGLGQQLTIPPNALQSGSVGFLNGQWRAAGGLQDAQTGKPVKLQYQFDNNGQAKVTVDRGNGILCQGTSQSSIVGGKLQMSGQATSTQCSDGSSFVLPQVTCTPDASGKSQCTGAGPDGRALPITIRQMP